MYEGDYCKMVYIREWNSGIEVTFADGSIVIIDKKDLFPDSTEYAPTIWSNILISESGHRFSMQRLGDMYKDRVEFHWSYIRALTDDKYKLRLLKIGSDYLKNLEGKEEPMIRKQNNKPPQ